MPNIFNRRFLAVQIAIVVFSVKVYDLYNHKWYPAEICLADSDGRSRGRGHDHGGRSDGEYDINNNQQSITLQYESPSPPPLPQSSSKSKSSSDSSRRRSRNITWTDPCHQLFSTEYVEARAKFRNAVSKFEERNKAKLYTLPVMTTVVVDGDGDDDTIEEFTIDVAVFPGSGRGGGGGTTSKKTIFHSSGVHGVEGFVGSAIQLALLQEGVLPFLWDDDEDDGNDASSSSSSDTERPNLVLIHAVNPVGMHQHRRFNENNVDLNRNCLINNALENEDVTASSGEQKDEVLTQKQKQYFDNFVANRDPNIASYEDFRDFLAPTEGSIEYPTTFYQHVGIWLRIVPKLIRHGYTHLKRAMVSGQYHHPKGLFFGGQELQPSITQLIHFLNSIRPDLLYGNMETSPGDEDGENIAESTATSSSSSSSSVVWIDVHSGLGPFGKDSLHCEVGSSVGDPDKVDIDTKSIFKTAYRSTVGMDADKHDDSSAFSGYELTKGGMTTMLKQMWEPKKTSHRDKKQKGLFVVQEFGTLPGILVGRSLILDNMLYQYHANDNQDDKERNVPDLSYRSPWLRYAFYPQSAEWRKSVIKRGVSLVLDAINFVET